MDAQRAALRDALADARRHRRSRASAGTPPTAPPCCATPASGSTPCVPGLLLYGVAPPPLATTLALRPAMSLVSRVVAIKGLRPGESVGYGARFTADDRATHRGRASRLRRWPGSSPRRARSRARGRPARADRRRGLDGHDHRRRHRRRHARPATRSCLLGLQGGEVHRRPRDGRRDRHDPLGGPLPRSAPGSSAYIIRPQAS